ncbi:MAG: hypothetical protein PHR92_17515 [Lachnospiraceae bacterium]|nr:hypothetical protein [Lachnospiraceae bacterium]
MSVISNLMVKIGADSSGLKKGLNDAKEHIRGSFDTAPVHDFSTQVDISRKSVEGLIGKLKTITILAAGGFGMTSMIKGIAEAGDNCYQLAQRMHITTAEAGTLSRIMSITGGDVTSLSSAIMRLDKSFSSTSTDGEKTRAILDSVGVSLTNYNGQLLPVNEQLKNLASGYKKATEAGYGQEFIMNTLGVKGMALVATLEQYNEAAEAAGKVKTVGMDPKEMHELNMQLKIMQMESAQIQNALVLGFAPVIQKFLPGIMTGLQTTAVFLRENKKEIAALTKAAVEFYIAMKTISLVTNVGAGILNFWKTATVAATESAVVQETVSAELSAKQIAQINKVVARSNQGYAKMEADAVKAAQKQGLASEEAKLKLEKDLLSIQFETEKTAAFITKTFTAHFMEVNAAAQAMAAGTTESIAATGAAATKSTTAQTVATVELTAAHVAEGTAAVKAGESNVAAATLATKATVAQTAAKGELTIAHVAEGNAAAVAGIKSATFAAGALRGVKALQAGVLALTGGWLGLAAAITYAGYCLYQYQSEKLAEEKARTYTIDGQDYEEKDGYFYTKDRINPDWQPDYSDEYSYLDENRYIKGGQLVTDSELDTKLRDAWWERHKDDEDYKAQLEKEAAEKKMQDADNRLAELMQNMGNGSGEGAKEAKVATEKQAVSYEVAVPVGEAVVDAAMNHLGESWGENTCAIFASSMLEEAGITGLSNPNGDRMAENAGAAYHDVNDGYQPKAGDVIEWGRHVGIYDGKGGYIASNTKTGIHQGSMQEAEEWFGPVQGYISTSEYTGNKTITKTMDASSKAMEDTVAKLNKAKEDATKLFSSMETEIQREIGTDYSYSMSQADANVRKKQLEINQLKTAGVDTRLLESELSDYEAVIKDKVTDKWEKANEEIKNSTAVTLAEVNSDYAKTAEAEYQITLKKLARERTEKEKEVLKDKADAEGRLALDEWYAAESLKALEKRNKSLRDNFSRTLADLEEKGDLASIKIALESDDAKNMMVLEGQREIARKYVEIWKGAHKTTAGMIADLAESVNSSLASSLKNFITGSATAMDVVHDLGKTILSTIAEIMAKKAAAQIVTSIFGIKLSNGGEIPGFATGGVLAGGFISGAGTGKSDSIVAYLESTGQFIRLSDGEFVMTAEATRKNRPALEAMNAGAYANGGYIYAPTVSRAGGSGMTGNTTPIAPGGVIVNITNNTDSKVEARESGYDVQAQRYILDIVIDGAQRNVNGFGSNLKSVMGG